MATFMLLSILVGFVYAQNCPGVYNYNGTKHDPNRFSSIQVGNYTIHVLMSLSSFSDCKYISNRGINYVMAINYAIEKLNKNMSLYNNASIGLQIDNVCFQLPMTMARGIEAVSFHRENSVCRSDFLKCSKSSGTTDPMVKKAVAVIGTLMSSTSIPLASLFSLYRIPQVSAYASSRLLSNKQLYKSFFRTIPSDQNQVSAMLDILRKFNWNYIFVVGSDDDYGKLAISWLKQEAKKSVQNHTICVSNDEYIPVRSKETSKKVKEVVDKIADNPKATVVILFCYAQGMGDEILKLAAERKLKRIWLTSEAWNPTIKVQLNKNSTEKQRTTGILLRNVSHGILSVSLMINPNDKFVEFIENRIRQTFNCDMWLQTYIHHEYECHSPLTLINDTFNCSNKKQLNVSTIMKNLRALTGDMDRLIDATTTIGHAILAVLKEKCPDTSQSCQVPTIDTKELTKKMFNVSFYNEHKEFISFDEFGDPKSAHYTIDNLVWDKSKQQYDYVQVGDWTQGRIENGLEMQLKLNKEKIQWPKWFNKTRKHSVTNETLNIDFPSSLCSDDCPPGYHEVGKHECCWTCHPCRGNNYSDSFNQKECKPCGLDKHSDKYNRKCIITPHYWMDITDPAGIGIVVLSVIGLLILCAIVYPLFGYWKFVIVNDKAPHITILCFFIVMVSFIFCVLHIVKPTEVFCKIRNSSFFLLLMLYAVVLLLKTRAMYTLLRQHAIRTFHGNLFGTQLLFMLLLFCAQLVACVVWLYLDGSQVTSFENRDANMGNKVVQIKEQCNVAFTTGRLVSTFMPCIILIIATFCAVRERLDEHSFYEPKFLSFSCVALCIIIIAFLPTFKFVTGIYQATVLAFTISIYAYTIMGCLILPKVYVGTIRKKRGINEYPLRPGTRKRKTQRKTVNATANNMVVDGVSLDTDTSEKQTKVSALSVSVANGGKEEYLNVDEIHMNEVEPGNGYKNGSFDPGQQNPGQQK